MDKQSKEFKVDVMVMRCAAFMGGAVQAICREKARVDGFGNPHYGFTRTVGVCNKMFDKA